MTVRQEDNIQCEMISDPARDWLANSWKEQKTLSLMCFYPDYGDICIKKASSIEEAKTMLNLAKPLHIQRWGRKKGQNAFVNPEFVRFDNA